jgi:hypothetical protein
MLRERNYKVPGIDVFPRTRLRENDRTTHRVDDEDPPD